MIVKRGSSYGVRVYLREKISGRRKVRVAAPDRFDVLVRHALANYRDEGAATLRDMTPEGHEAVSAEFDRQLESLLEKGYPEAAGVKPAEFVKHVDPLREAVEGLVTLDHRADAGRVPFVVVVKSDLVAGDQAIKRVERRDTTGFSVLDPDDIECFEPIESLTLPDSSAYLMLDIDTGRDTLNITPNEALEIIDDRGRSPLTINEGIALVTHYPEAVAKNGGFSLLGSRCGDRRVTALWISEGRPKLGWCWAGNPHTWLGSASCDSRIGETRAGAA